MIDRIAPELLNTGNEFISIPDINTSTAGLDRVGFLHEGFRGCIELHGTPDIPLIRPLLEIDGEDLYGGNIVGDLVSYWIPKFTISSPRVQASASIFAPLDRKGFICVLHIKNTSSEPIKLKAGWTGSWGATTYTARKSRPMSGCKHGYITEEGCAVFEFRGNSPLFAMAVHPGDDIVTEIENEDKEKWRGGNPLAAEADKPLCFEVCGELTIQPNRETVAVAYIGIGLEAVSAAASAAELRIQGWERAFANLEIWLDSHTILCDDPFYKRLMNTNSFYAHFYGTGTTLDNEQLVITSSRSSANDLCGSYSDRDAMRWILPSVLQINPALARRMLLYTMHDQLRNVGAASRFIGGSLMEAGLQLDSLCSPIRGLRGYVESTGDMSIVFDRRVQNGVNTVQQILAAQRHPDYALFETLLLPSGKPAAMPYVCFSNVLVWRAISDIGWLYDRIRDLDRAEEASRLANKIKEAIMKHFVVSGPNGYVFAKAIDLRGGFELGDITEGSLKLLSFFGFCSPEDPVYKNTTAMMETDVSDNLAVLSLINELITSNKEDALSLLRKTAFTDCIACESVNKETGASGGCKARAGIAGYLAFGMRLALDATCPAEAVAQHRDRPSEALYHPPPEINHDTRKARM